MSPRRDLLPALTSLRFFVAVGILCVHLWGAICLMEGEITPAVAGHLAVGAQFFFVLSGFILTYNYLDEFRSPTRRGTWNYIAARWARVFPVHLLACLVALPLIYYPLRYGAMGDPVGIVATHLLMLHGFLSEYGARANAFNPPSWSISTEWFFYLMLPLLIPGLTTGSLRRRAAVLLVALSPWLFATAAAAGAFPMPKWVSPYRCPPVRLIDFVVGIGLGAMWRRRYPAGLPANPSVGRGTLVEVGAVLVTAAWAWACVRVSDSELWPATARWVGVYLPPLALLIWVFAHGRGLGGKLLASRPMVYLGEISPGVYLLHWPVMVYIFTYGGGIKYLTGEGWRWFAVIGVTTVASAACYHLYERPARDLLRRALSIRRPAAPALVEVPRPATAAPAEAPARRAA